MQTLLRSAVIAFGIVAIAPLDALAAPPMQFELVTESGFPLAGSKKWIEFLAKLEQTSIRIRQSEPGDQPALSNQGTEQRPVYFVQGVLTRGNRLLLPGGDFGLSDREKLATWIKKVETDGVHGPTQKTVAFGLLPEQLVAFHEKLTGPVATATKGQRAGDLSRVLVKSLAIEFTVTEQARKAFAGDELVADELQGLSCGTALAATLRPLGLVFRPEKSGSNIKLLICDVRESEEAWPVGWPPEEIPGKLVPKFSEQLDVKITNVTIDKALAALQPRIEVPFLFDHNSIARKSIDLSKSTVTYPPSHVTHRKVFDKVLFTGGLTHDLRVDEAGRPFLWIRPR